MKKIYVPVFGMMSVLSAHAQQVGINTDGTPPTMFLHVKVPNGNDGIRIQNASGAGDAHINFQDGATDRWTIGFDNTDNEFHFSNSATLGTTDILNLEMSADGGQIKAGLDGAEAAPIWSWDSDPQTGIWHPADDQMAFGAGGVEFLTMIEGVADILVFNEDSDDIDFRMESNNQLNQFYLNAASDQILIRNNTMHLGYTDPFCVYVSDNVTIPFGVSSWNQGTTGGAGTFENSSLTNGYNTVEATRSAALGNALWTWNTSATNNATALNTTTGAGNNRWGIVNDDETLALNYFVISDARLKRDIKPLQDALKAVMELNPVTYLLDNITYPSFGTSEEQQFGFLAQELAVLFPDLVAENSVRDPNTTPQSTRSDWAETKTPFSAVNYIGLIPVLTQAIKEQQEIIKSLEQRIEDLENR